jgi:hypothetical protein
VLPKIARWLALACLAYLMLLPVGNDQVLLPIIGVFGFASFLAVIIEHRRPSPEVVIVIGGVLVVGVYGTLIGITNPGVVNGGLVWLAAPLIFGFWVLAGTERSLSLIMWLSAIATVVSSAWIIVYVASELGWVPPVFPLPVLQFVGAGFDHGIRGSTKILFYGISTLIASAPMWVTSAVLPRSPMLPPKGLTIVTASFAAAATLLVGRGALTILFVAVPVCLWALWRIVTRKLPRGRWHAMAPFAFIIALAAALALLVSLGNTTVQSVWARVISVFTGQGQSTNDHIRSVEATKLLQAWSTNPILGHGFGAVIPGYARSATRPWNFELQYHLILFQVGVGGALVLLGVVGFAVYGFVRAARVRPDMLPALLVAAAGALAILIANATNPYLQAPGNMWPVYFLLMVINVVLVDASANRGTPARGVGVGKTLRGSGQDFVDDDSGILIAGDDTVGAS